VAKLFVAKSAFAAFLILSIGLTAEDYPLLPRHLTLAAFLTIGVPAFFLALAPSSGEWRPRRFLRETAHFAVPTGVAAGLGVVAAFLLARNVFELSLVSSRTVATTVLIVVGLYLVIVLEAAEGRLTWPVWTLVGAMFFLYLIVLSLPATRSFFEVVAPGPRVTLAALVGAALAIGFLWATADRFWPFGKGPAVR
jgi:magnesium-transporting ATPase (P-type)